MDLTGLGQNIDLNTLAIIAVGLCAVGVVAFVLVHVFGLFFGVFGGILELVAHLVTGGPVTWCGCLVVALGCGACGFFAYVMLSLLSSCGTAQAVNFCRVFGR